MIILIIITFHVKTIEQGMGYAKKLIIFRGDVLTHLVKNDISNIVQFATEFEDEFVKIVVDEDYTKEKSRSVKQNA